MLIAVLAGIAAGACFAVGGTLQQRVASTRPEGESLSLRLLKDLATQRVWLAGIAFAVLSYGFQALALNFGPLSMVQPLIVSELVFAIPLSARLHHVRLGWRSWVGAIAVSGGLAGAIVAASPEEGNPAAAGTLGWIITLGTVVVLSTAALLLGRRLSGPARGSLFAFAGGLVMGTQSALFAVTVHNISRGAVVLFTAWQTYLLIVASIGGLLLLQSALQAGPLASSLPVVDATEPVVAIVIGMTLFDEAIAAGLLRQILAALAMAVVIAGIVVLDTSPVTHKLYEKQRRSREDDDSGQIELRE